MRISALHFLAAAAFTGAVISAAVSIENKALPPQEEPRAEVPGEDRSTPSGFYEKGDWFTYVIVPSYRTPEEKGQVLFENTSFESDSFVKFNAVYGKSVFTSSKYIRFDGDRAVSNVIKDGFNPSNEVRLLVQGHVGKRLTVFIDHDSDRDLQEQNTYVMKYRAVDDDEVIREINAGDIDLKMDKSKYAFYDSGGQKSIGVDSTLKKGDLTLRGFVSVSKGSDETETFSGASTSASSSVSEYQYIRNTYFQLEPYIRYDGISSASTVSTKGYSALVTFTSAPADPSSYLPHSVNLAPSSVEVWLDPQTAVSNVNAVALPVYGGAYTKLTEGTDYKTNYVTGEITFLRSINAKNRIIAGYRLAGGASSSDPAVRTDVFSGKIAVCIKYGTSIEEDPGLDGTSDGDANSDGRFNHDVYEIRSRYLIGDRKIKPDNFTFTLYKSNSVALATDTAKLGRFNIDYSAGVVAYLLREPFRPLLGTAAASQIYSQTATDLYESSSFSQKFSYVRDARSFQLKHMSLVQGSVTVKVNGASLSPSLYSCNYVSGTVEFVDANNPVITDTTPIEIRYQYSQADLSSKGFLGGTRADYRFNEVLSAGGTMLYGRSNAADVIPQQGSEPTQNIVFEGDTTVAAGPEKFGRLASAVTDGLVDHLPISFKGYAEYARSIYDVNTFGKMLIDDMETDTEEAAVSLSERDWVLSSLPTGTQLNRAMILYKYYRSLSALSVLRGFDFNPYAVNYSSKAGPYNVQDGHVAFADSSKNSVRSSLVFEADFSSGHYAAAATRINSGNETDLSALQYVEVWYRSTGGTGSVNLSMDIGQINEDADGSGVLRTEDSNLNGYLDKDLTQSIDEDVGYAFTPSGGISTRVGNGPGLNSATKGDGTLTSEDLNNNGSLDTTEKTVSFPGNFAWKDSDPAYSPLSISLSDTSWKKTRIYLKKNTLTAAEIYNLKHAVSLRLVLNSGGAASKATILIDSLRIVTSRWKDIYINGISNEDVTKMKVNLVDTWNDSEYNANSFMIKEKSEYTSLYGSRTNSDIHDEKESSLSLTYALSGGYASATRHFVKSFDLRQYHTLNLWVNPREVTNGDYMRIYLCTGTGDYTYYDVPLSWSSSWREITLKLDSKSKGAYSVTGTSGVPDRGQITMMKAEIHGSSGRVWIDTIIASDPYTLTGDAYWFEGAVKVTRPLYITDGGTAVGRDLSLSVIRKSHSANYNSPGRNDLGKSDESNEFRTSTEILPGWKNTFGAAFSTSSVDSFDSSFSDSERGTTKRDVYSFLSEYRSGKRSDPVVLFSYQGEKLANDKSEYLSDSRISQLTKRNTQSPNIVYEQAITDYFSGVWNIRAALTNTFYSETISRKDSDGDALLSTSMSAHTHDAWQKNSLNCLLDYSLGHIFFSPQYLVYSHETVAFSGGSDQSGTILSDVDGSFHLPFQETKEARYIERSSEYSLRWGLRDIPYCSFSDTTDFIYGQNSFRDYTSSEKLQYEGFARDHGTNAAASRIITLPFSFSEPLFGSIRTASITWSRKMFFTETGVPYEGEGSDFYSENYGIKRTAGGIGTEILNLGQYSPWYFFLGRGTGANARDHINSRLNTPVSVDGIGVSSYGNDLKLVENAAVTTGLVFKGASLNAGASANEVCERQTVSSLPGQQLTLSANADIGINLMDLFSFGFFRPNTGKEAVHASRCTLGYIFSRTMIITSNIVEESHQPSFGLSFQSGRSIVSFSFGLDLRHRENHNFISADAGKRSSSDDAYYNAMSHDKVDELSKGYTLKTRYETDIPFVRDFFARFYPFVSMPVFSAEYDLILNRYDYSYSVSPEPYDQHLFTLGLDCTLHKNVKGGLTAQAALERWYNRSTHGLYREIVSYNLGFNVTALF